MANKKIKGLTVEIGGDTTKLGNALDNSQKKTKSLQSELKQVDKLLKMDPKNVELLAQKQKILTEQVEETKKRLSLLRDEQGKVNEMYQKGEIGEAEYRKFQREIEKTKQDLEGFEKQLKTTGDEFAEVQRKSGAVTFKNAENKVEHFKGKVSDMAKSAIEDAEKLSKKLDTVGDGLEKAGSVINKGSAAAAAVLAGSVASFKDLDEGYDVIVKKTGATDDKFESLKKTADELFSGSTFDMTDIGNAIGEVNTRFGFTEDKLKSVTEQYLQFAKINDADVSDSISKTARIMQAWDISADNLPDLLGMITAKGQETGVAVGGLMDKVLDNNATFKEMGLSLEESITLMAQFERNGVNDSTALTAMKTAVKNAAEEGKPLSDVLRENVNDIKNASNETEALQKATELFGSKGAAEMANAIKEGRIDFDNLSGSMSSYKDTVKKTYDATLDPLEESKQVINNLKLAGADLAATALKEGQPLIEDVIDGVKGVTNWLKKLTPEEKKTLTEAIKIVAVAGPAVTIGGKLTKGIGNIIGFLPKMASATTSATTAQTGLNAAMDANPIGAVILAVTALTAVFFGLKSAIDSANQQRLEDLGFTAQTEELEKSIEKVNDLKENVNGLVKDAGDSFIDMSSNMGVIDDYKERLDTLLEKANLTPSEQAELVTIGDYFKEKYPEFATVWDEYVKRDADGKLSIIGDVDELKGKLDELIDKYKKVAASSALSDLMKKNTESYIAAKQDVNSSAIELKKAKQKLQNWQKEWGINSADTLQTMLTSPGNYTWQNKTNTKTATVDDLQKQYETLTDTISQAEAAYDETAESAAQLRLNTDDLSRMQAVLDGNYEDASAVLMAYNANMISASQIEQNRGESLDSLRYEAEKTAKETGKNCIYGFKNGIDAYKGEIRTEGIENAQSYLDTVDKTLGIQSPSKEMYKRGVYVVQGFVNGIRDGMKTVWDVAQNLGSTALNAVKSFLGIASPSKEAAKLGRFTAEGFAEGIESGGEQTRKSAEELAEWARNALGDKISLLDDYMPYSLPQSQILTEYNVTHTHDFKQSAELKTMRNDIRDLNARMDALAKRPINLYLDGRTFVGSTIQETDRQLGELAFKRNMGV